MFKSAKFAIGQLVQHKLFAYRGVVIDVDPHFNLTDEWYDAVARTRPPKDQPWYRVLVDGEAHETYVAERNLELDSEPRAIRHPELHRYFSRLDGDLYIRADRLN
jgi:heat shock protein HspQ